MYKVIFILFFTYNKFFGRTALFNSGDDERFNEIKQDTPDINVIISYIEKYKLLKQYKDPNLSIMKKMELLKSNCKRNKINPANLIEGGLFDEFLQN